MANLQEVIKAIDADQKQTRRWKLRKSELDAIRGFFVTPWIIQSPAKMADLLKTFATVIIMLLNHIYSVMPEVEDDELEKQIPVTVGRIETAESEGSDG